ncbi:MAG: transcription elongation factor GreA [Zetaproteobacteria bacterium]|nr:transcription elongation factor GreA [Zetaproteobacteria bacterium]
MKRPMTPYGYAVMRRELRKLKAMRPELAHAIEVARANGDLKENADYHAAKDKSGMVEAKIRDYETKLSVAEVIDTSKSREAGRVVFGAEVKIEDLDSGAERTVTIVGADETDTSKGYISFESPFGRALIGKELGDVAKVIAPGGAREYEIMDVTYLDWESKAKEVES